jgi:carbon-monoxide dehydrogenase medium subunit
LTEERLQETARVVAEEVTPISDMRGSEWYRREVVGILAYRVLAKAWQLAAGDGGGR